MDYFHSTLRRVKSIGPSPVIGAIRAKLTKGRLLILCFTAFVEYCCIGILLTVIPFYIAKTAPSLNAAVLSIGLVQSLFGISQVATASFVGALSDRFGRRNTLMTTLISTSILIYLLSFTHQLYWILILRLLTGTCQHSLVIVTAYVSSLSETKDIPANLSKISASNGIGFIAGASLVGLISHHGLAACIQIAAALTFINSIVVFLRLPIEKVKVEYHASFSNSADILSLYTSKLKGIKDIFKINRQKLLYYSFVLQSVAGFTSFSIWAIYFKIKFSWTAQQAGASLFVFGVTLLISQIFLPPLLLRKISIYQLTLLSLTSSAIISFLFGVASNPVYIYVLIIINIFGCLSDSMIRSMICSQFSAEIQGAVMGKIGSLYALGPCLAPLIGSAITLPYSTSTNDSALSLIPFAGISLMYALALVAIISYKKNSQTNLAFMMGKN